MRQIPIRQQQQRQQQKNGRRLSQIEIVMLLMLPYYIIILFAWTSTTRHAPPRTDVMLELKKSFQHSYKKRGPKTNNQGTSTFGSTIGQKEEEESNVPATTKIFRISKKTKPESIKSTSFTSPTDGAAIPVVVRRWAYAFLVGGCSPSKPQYQGFLYNVIVSAKILKEKGSVADVVVMVQMSTTTDEIRLPEDDEKLLRAVGVKIVYLPKFRDEVHEVFYGLVMEKFRVLQLTDYSRVLFLDADMMPVCNMDYMFELSEPDPKQKGSNNSKPLLKENLILSYKDDVANAGLFMLQPNQADFDLLQEHIRRKEEKALQMPYPHWDEVEGWGHNITEDDHWRNAVGENGTKWNWFSAFADQGLIYYWPKYVKQSVSIVIFNDIDHWGSQDGAAFFEGTTDGTILSQHSCTKPDVDGVYRPPSPYRDFYHFTGRSKPWTLRSTPKGKHRLRVQMWIKALDEVCDMAGLPHFEWLAIGRSGSTNNNSTLSEEKKKNGKHMDPKGPPPVGAFSTYDGMIKHIRAKANNNWYPYL